RTGVASQSERSNGCPVRCTPHREEAGSVGAFIVSPKRVRAAPIRTKQHQRACRPAGGDKASKNHNRRACQMHGAITRGYGASSKAPGARITSRATLWYKVGVTSS